MTKVKAIVAFYDREKKVNRKVGEEFTVSEERLAQLNACGIEQGGAPLVKEVAKPARKKAEEAE